jgi:ribosomal protein S27AE
MHRMPKLACRSCGRQIYTVAPLESLFAEERRCPRCGAFLNSERRDVDRREHVRRQNRTDEPGPPTEEERREAERRKGRRRKPAGS